jgi:glucose/arabinose dehydrogenase
MLDGSGPPPFDRVVPSALAGPAAAPDNSLSLQPLVTSGLTRPLLVANAGNGSNRLFIVEQGGLIKVFTNGQVLGTPFLDLTGAVVTSSEQGLLGLAFHPSYRTNGRFFVFYTARVTSSTVGVGDNVLAEYRASPPGSNQAVATATRVLFSLSDPYTNHNGGNLGFGPDGFLYVGTGDGGDAGDPQNRAPNRQSLFGKMLRLDVDNIPSGQTYGIPPSNPFVGQSGTLPEIWALGLRNPWRWSFDRGASTSDPNRGALFIGDVGQAAWEEIDRAPPGVGGQNYGWRIREGAHCFNPPTGCSTAGLVDPILEYDHSLGCAVIGGFVYRGAAFPSLQGTYLYADECSGRIWKARPQGSVWTSTEALDTMLSPSSFAEDESGELYLVDLKGGLYHVRTAAAATIGGKNLGITPWIGLDLTWTGGDQQLGFLVVRDPMASTVLPAGATVYADVAPAPPPALNCYVLVPFGPAGPLGVSDALCAQRGLASPVGAPQGFTLRLNQSSTASLSWANAPGTVGSILVALPLDGRPARYQPLAAGTTSATDATGGAFTCYLLVAGTLFGQFNTDLACGLPGVSTLGTTAAIAAPPSTASTEQARAQAEQRLERQRERLRPRLEQLGPKVHDALQEAKKRLDRSSRR